MRRGAGPPPPKSSNASPASTSTPGPTHWSSASLSSRPAQVAAGVAVAGRCRSLASSTRPIAGTSTASTSATGLAQAIDPTGLKAQSDLLVEGGDALAAADAHRDHGSPAAGAAEFVEGLDGQDAAGGADRVAQGNATPVGVGLFGGKAKLPGDGQSLGGEGLVGLEDVDVVHGQPDPVEQPADGRH